MKITLIALIYWLVPTLAHSQQEPGGLADGAIRLQAENISRLNYGSAVITQGSKTALIDTKGKFILPYGQYHILTHDLERGQGYVHKGFYEVTGANLPNGGIINSKGKLIYKPPLGADFHLEDPDNSPDQLFCVVTENLYSKEGGVRKTCLLISYQGTILRLGNMQISGVGEGLLTFRYPDAYLFGYADTLGNILVTPRFSRAFNFSDGLAAVCMIDDYHDDHWGFVNKTGRFIISPRFDMPPSDFSDGLAAFINVRKKNNEAGFINKAGDTVIHIPSETHFIYDFNIHFARFCGEYFLDGEPIVKKDGRLMSESTFLEGFGLDSTMKLGYRKYGNQVMINNVKGTGILFIDTKKFIRPVFEYLTLFEQPAGSARAVLDTQRQEDDRQIYRVGLINERGQFTVYCETFYYH